MFYTLFYPLIVLYEQKTAKYLRINLPGTVHIYFSIIVNKVVLAASRLSTSIQALLLLLLLLLAPIEERSIVMSVSVCVCVCLSVRDNVFGTTRPIFAIFCACYIWLWLSPPLAA